MIAVELPGANVLFTDRNGGVSTGPYESLNLGFLTDDDPQSIEQNQQIVRRICGVEQLRFNVQVHGTKVTASDRADHVPVEADGIHSNHSDVALVAFGADCLPVAFAADDRIGILHCGWRGLAAGLISTALADLGGRIAAAVGPGICQSHFEVSEQVLDHFADFPSAIDDRNLDLREVARIQLDWAGVAAVIDVPRCTFCEPENFFSHRRDGAVTGRQAGLVWRQ